MQDHFFSEGDEGRYEGGPATFEEQHEHLAAIEADVLEEKRQSIVRTPEQEARRAKFVRLVVRVVGSCVAVLLVALVWARIRADREAPYTPPATTVMPPSVEAESQPPAKPEPPREAPAPVVAEPKEVGPSAAEQEAQKPVPAEAANPNSPAEVSRPPTPAPVEPKPAAAPARPRPTPPVRAERPRPERPSPVVAPPSPPAPRAPGDAPPTAAFPVE
jgi:cytoskeletal protein RodZ